MAKMAKQGKVNWRVIPKMMKHGGLKQNKQKFEGLIGIWFNIKDCYASAAVYSICRHFREILRF